MARLCMLFLAVFLVVISACGSDSSPTAPVLLPESRSTFLGEWEGMLSKIEITKDSDSATEGFRNLACSLVFNQNRYSLHMQMDDTVVDCEITQEGEWAWDEDNPGHIVFSFDSEICSWATVALYSHQHSTVSDNDPGSWQARLEFTDGYARLRIVEMVKEQGVSSFPVSSTFELSRIVL